MNTNLTLAFNWKTFNMSYNNPCNVLVLLYLYRVNMNAHRNGLMTSSAFRMVSYEPQFPNAILELNEMFLENECSTE